MSVVCSSALRLLAGCDPDPLGVASGDQVSIHASAQEATLCAWGDGGCAPYVSIHASAQEATRQPDRKAGASVFRSTPPRRWRRRWSSLTGLMSMFRSTPPRRRRPFGALNQQTDFQFRSTPPRRRRPVYLARRSEEHTSELQSL